MTSSILDGGAAPALAAANLAELLPRAARRTTGAAIHFINADGTESALSYAELLDSACRVLGGLRRAGVRTGERVVLHLRDNQDLLVAFWACVLGGFVAVPTGAGPTGLAPERGYRWLVADRTHPDGPHWIGTVANLASGAPDHLWFAADAGDVVLLTKTAGSSGAPKPVLLDHGNVLSRSAATIQDNRLDETAVTLNSMPLDHVGGLVMFHLRDVQLACTQVHAHRDWILGDPARWLDIVDRFRVTVAWGTTSVLDAITSRATTGSWNLDCLDYVMNGGEPVKARTIRRFLTALAPFGLASTAVRPGWGMSETSAGVIDHRLDLDDLRHADDRHVPVGTPHAGIKVRVVDEHGTVVPEHVEGRMQVSGASVTSGYADGHPANGTAFTPDGWLDTGDFAIVSEGVLTVTGNTAGALWIDDVLHHAHLIESTVAELPCAERGPVGACLVDGELVVAYAGEYDEDAVRAAVLARHGLHVHRVVVLPADTFPTTRTGKPRRAALRDIISSKENRVRHH
ncbi:AMP-binding protein [Actinosynnema sp. NPDC050801]|uniref:AMP-binding protein n=1 Tax=unclassified Actinosynnema TaxID=2637065 RepID=UPI00340F73FE